MSRFRILLADDHVLLRQGLKRIIEESPELEVIGEAGDGLELLSLMNRMSPDIVVLDISMPNLRGIEAVAEIKSRYPKVKVLMLTMYREKEFFCQAVASGADGYLLKEDADTELFSAIRRIRQGKVYVSPSLSDELADFVAQSGRGRVVPPFSGEVLTTREREVLKLVAEGKTSKEAADLLCVSVRTIDHHRANVMAKLSLRKTADLVRYAARQGYI